MAEVTIRSDFHGGWSRKFSEGTRSQQHHLPRLIGNPAVDYDCVKWLCNIQGIGERDRPSTSEAHQIFMENYQKMFPRPAKLLSLQPPPADKRKLDHRQKETKIPHDKGFLPHWCKGFDEYLCSHNISQHMSKLHKHNFVITSPASVFNARIRAIRKILRKLPFERKSKENEALFKHLQFFPDLAEQVAPNILKELCTVAQLDKWNEADFTVFGNTGIHLILRGAVVPQTEPCISPVSPVPASRQFRSPTPIFGDHELRAKTALSAGECFGTLEKVEGREANTRILSVITLEPCEFLKISTNDFDRVMQLINSREEEKKLSLAQTCKLFYKWPRLSLRKIAGLIRWRKFPAGQVLVNEGERCEIIAFIKKGHCVLKRMITVAHTYPNGTKEKRTKPVVIGRLGPGDSFGETTVLKNSVMPCAVTTDSLVELGTISSLDVYDLDETTKSLLIQSYFAMDSNMTEEEIQKEYIEQEKAEEWNRFKSKVVGDVLYYRDILPGYSKWSRNPSPKDVGDF